MADQDKVERIVAEIESADAEDQFRILLELSTLIAIALGMDSMKTRTRLNENPGCGRAYGEVKAERERQR